MYRELFSLPAKEMDNFLLFLVSGDFCRLLITFANSLEPDQVVSVLIWIQTVCHSDSIAERIFLKKLILKKSQQTTSKSMKNYPACKEFKGWENCCSVKIPHWHNFFQNSVPSLKNSVDPEQLASEEGSCSGSTVFHSQKGIHINDEIAQIDWLENKNL